MLRDAYRFFETPEGGFLIFRLDDFLELSPPGFTFPISPAQLERLALADRSGSKWVFFEGDEQCRDFIKLLALSTNTTEQEIMGRITRHPLSGADEIIRFILSSADPSSLEEISQWRSA